VKRRKETFPALMYPLKGGRGESRNITPRPRKNLAEGEGIITTTTDERKKKKGTSATWLRSLKEREMV